MTLLATALAYHRAGLIVLPDDPLLKYPADLPHWETLTPTEPLINAWWKRWPERGIGVRDKEGLDIDNKGMPNADDLYDQWTQLAESLAPGLVNRLLCERTPSGGYHIVWNCATAAGNQKLATRPPTTEELAQQPKLTSVTLIETRGTGGQFQVAPSPGYELLRGDWTALPSITAAERQIILDCARALTQGTRRTAAPARTAGRPGDTYNATRQEESLALLKQAGWRVLYARGSTQYLCRPGKDRGISATYGYIAPDVLYVFSSNASPFEPEHAYTPFAIYAELAHGGDYTAAAAALRKQAAYRGGPINRATGELLDADPSEPEAPAPLPSDALPLCPPLPASAQLPPELTQGACRWLDRFVAWSRQWSPRAYDGFHQSVGLWVLSTVAARRVQLAFGGERAPSLYIALCARTSLFAKSTTAKLGLALLHAAGLSHLLAADDATPQAFVRALAGRLPGDYAERSEAEQSKIRRRLAFAAQRGWWYEEFGQKIAAMMKDGGFMADFRGLLRKLDDAPPGYEYDSIQRTDVVELPYLALLANLTPADLQPYAKRGATLWGDGFWARFAFVTPPPDSPRPIGRFPAGEITIPDDLSMALRSWHIRLGIPMVAIVDITNEKGDTTGQRAEREPLPRTSLMLDRAVADAFYAYNDALLDIVSESRHQDLDGNYARFAEKALRVAMLVASLEHDNHIGMAQWALGQAVAEQWRRELHHLIEQVQAPAMESREADLEIRVQAVIGRQQTATANDLRRFIAGIGVAELQQTLDVLEHAGLVTTTLNRKRNKVYQLTEDALLANRSNRSAANRRGDLFPATIDPLPPPLGTPGANGSAKEHLSTIHDTPLSTIQAPHINDDDEIDSLLKEKKKGGGGSTPLPSDRALRQAAADKRHDDSQIEQSGMAVAAARWSKALAYAGSIRDHTRRAEQLERVKVAQQAAQQAAQQPTNEKEA